MDEFFYRGIWQQRFTASQAQCPVWCAVCDGGFNPFQNEPRGVFPSWKRGIWN